jgi:hypothetical protein
MPGLRSLRPVEHISLRCIGLPGLLAVTKKQTLSVKIDREDLAEIDRLIQLTGGNRSTWLIGVIRAALGRSDVVTIQGVVARLEARIEKVEMRLDSLGRAIA